MFSHGIKFNTYTSQSVAIYAYTWCLILFYPLTSEQRRYLQCIPYMYTTDNYYYFLESHKCPCKSSECPTQVKYLHILV